jgi:hypothetical protein
MRKFKHTDTRSLIEQLEKGENMIIDKNHFMYIMHQ